MNKRVVNSLIGSVTDTPFVQFHKEQSRAVLHQQLPFQQYTNQSYSSTFYPPSTAIILDRAFKLQYTMKCTSASTDFTDSLRLGAPRAFPLNSVINTCVISINGGSISSQPSHMVRVLQRFNNNALFRSRYWSTFPSQPDPENEYSRLVPWKTVANTTTAVALIMGGEVLTNSWSVYPNLASPFCEEEQIPMCGSVDEPRACFPYAEDGYAGDQKTFTMTEPLLHPICNDGDMRMGLSNVQALTVYLTFDSNLGRMWSSAQTVDTLAVTINSVAPQLLISYVELDNPALVPRELTLPTYEHRIYQTNSSTVAINATQQVTMPSIILSQVPSKFYLWAEFNDMNSGTTNYEYADGSAVITALQVQIGTSPQLFASASQQQLFDISVKNGLQCTWNQFSRRLGSYICFTPDDIGIYQAGAVGNIPLTVTATIKNTFETAVGHQKLPATANTVTFTIYLVAELEGKLTVTPDSAVTTLGLYPSDIVASQGDEVPMVDEKSADAGSGMLASGVGGRVNWHKIWRHIKHGLHLTTKVGNSLNEQGVLPAHPYVQNTLRGANVAHNTVQSTGLGWLRS